MAWVKEYVSQIAAFIILISVVNMIMPKNGTARAARLVLSAALLGLVIAPVSKALTFLKSGSAASLQSAQFAFDAAAMEREARFYEEGQRAEIIKTYCGSLENMLADVIKSYGAIDGGYTLVSSHFEIDGSDEGFGVIKYINIKLAREEGGEAAKPLIRVEKPGIKVNIYGDKLESEVEEGEFMGLKKAISSFYGVDAGNIFIESGDM